MLEWFAKNSLLVTADTRLFFIFFCAFRSRECCFSRWFYAERIALLKDRKHPWFERQPPGSRPVLFDAGGNSTRSDSLGSTFGPGVIDLIHQCLRANVPQNEALVNRGVDSLKNFFIGSA